MNGLCQKDEKRIVYRPKEKGQNIYLHVLSLYAS